MKKYTYERVVCRDFKTEIVPECLDCDERFKCWTQEPVLELLE